MVSNLHVFERASNAIAKKVVTGEMSRATEVVGMYARQDICIFRIDTMNFKPLKMGDSYNVRTGDEVYVASNPKGLEGSFAKGIVSAVRNKESLSVLKKNESVAGSAGDFDRFVADYRGLDTIFQIDAAISSGSSGGALIDRNGDIVGIIFSSLLSGQNLNFAIPINLIKELPLQFHHSIQLAGASAYSDRKKEKLYGLVKSLREKETPKAAGTGKEISDELISTSLKTFDLDGNTVEWTLFDATNGEFGVKYVYKFDDNNLHVSMSSQYKTGVIKDAKFDLESRIRRKIEQRYFSGNFGTIDGLGGMRLYNAYGNVTTWLFRATKQVYRYDKNGRTIEKTQSENGIVYLITRYEYEDDSHGNWIVQRTHQRFPNSPSVDPNRWFEAEIYYREISYYK